MSYSHRPDDGANGKASKSERATEHRRHSTSRALYEHIAL